VGQGLIENSVLHSQEKNEMARFMAVIAPFSD
jgi:hypothetical protein